MYNYFPIKIKYTKNKFLFIYKNYEQNSKYCKFSLRAIKG